MEWRRLPRLDLARRRERLRKRVQQQHNGVVVMEWQFSGRASPSSRGGGEVLEGRGYARCKGVAALPPLHYL